MERVPAHDVLITVCDLNERVPAHDVLIAVFYLNGESAWTRRFNYRV